ncbi:MAG: metalloregulator ArsR/SmtB family transcription factor [Streptosporangiales bacterium]|nr:metalloregulator ArsR/SmtB family transcription factor [Streptosporangiales bacterium]
MLTYETREAAMARLGTALSDTNRRRLLIALLDGPGYPAELAERLGLTRSNVSNHLACLRGCGLVVAGYEGRKARYELADPRLVHALDDLMHVVLATNPEHCPPDHPHPGSPAAATPPASSVANLPPAEASPPAEAWAAERAAAETAAVERAAAERAPVERRDAAGGRSRVGEVGERTLGGRG